jgi:hypothetical protein
LKFTKMIRACICKHLRSPGIDSANVVCRAGSTNTVVVQARQAGNRFLGSLKGLQIRAQHGRVCVSADRSWKGGRGGGVLGFTTYAGIFEQSMGARNQVGIGFSCRPARLHRLAESIPWNRFLGSIEVKKYRLCLFVTVGVPGT